jgi:hypothetical protein
MNYRLSSGGSEVMGTTCNLMIINALEMITHTVWSLGWNHFQDNRCFPTESGILQALLSNLFFDGILKE